MLRIYGIQFVAIWETIQVLPGSLISLESTANKAVQQLGHEDGTATGRGGSSANWIWEESEACNCGTCAVLYS